MTHRSDHTTEHHIHVAVVDSADTSVLLQLVSIFHSRGVAVADMAYGTSGDGSAVLTARFHSTAHHASVVARTVERAVCVSDVELSTSALTGSLAAPAR